MPRQPIKPCNPNIAYWFFWFPLAFMQALDTTIVNTAIPAMAHHLNEDPLRMHSVVVAYVLSVAACIPLSGWLADRFGVRNTFYQQSLFSHLLP